MDGISVIMSTYKENIDDLKMSIESILNQTYKMFEFIIILDNPNNHIHEEIIKEYSKFDKRIKFYKNEKNIGLAMSLNKGISLAQYEYIARMDADDISLSNRFEKQIKFLQKNPDVSLVATNKILIDENNSIVGYGNKLPKKQTTIKKGLEYISMVVHPSVMARKKDIEIVNGYRNFPASQDYDLWLRLISNEKKISFIDEYLIKYRMGTSNITGGNSLKQWMCDKYIKQLYRERIKSGQDTFSEQNLKLFLELNNCNSEDKKESFKMARGFFDLARNTIKKKRYMLGLIYLNKAILSNIEIINVILNSIKYQLLICRE